MNCIIVKNGFFNGKSLQEQVYSLKEELEKLGAEVEVKTTNELICFLDGGARSTIGKADFVVYLDKDPYISVMLEKAGYKLVNSSKAVEICDDKMKTYLELEGVVRLPETIASPLNYTSKTDEFYLEVEKKLAYPVVVKEVYGSMGKGVFLAENEGELRALHERLNFKPHIFQRFVGLGGEDVRVIVIGGKAVAAMKRSNEKDFRSNVELGGIGTPFSTDSEEARLAELCAKKIGLDYCGVDILSENDEKFVCEVNSNAFWSGIRRATGVNVAGLYANYLVNKFRK